MAKSLQVACIAKSLFSVLTPCLGHIILLKQGQYRIQDGQFRQIASTDGPTRKVFEVPKDMEVIILGHDGLCQLLGKKNVKALAELVEDRTNVTAFSRLLLPVRRQGTCLVGCCWTLNLLIQTWNRPRKNNAKTTL